MAALERLRDRIAAEGKAQLRQAAEAFEQVERLGRYDGPLNLARVLYTEGRLDEATQAVRRAASCSNPAAPNWTLAWLSGLVNREQGDLAKAEENFRSVLQDQTQERIDRGFDFSQDYEVINLLGQTLYERGRTLRGQRSSPNAHSCCKRPCSGSSEPWPSTRRT